MKYLPLYPEPQRSAIERVVPCVTNSSCTDCPLHENSKNPCLAPEGNSTGGILVVGEFPFVADDVRGRPFTSTHGARLRRSLSKVYSGPISLDYAVKCVSTRGGKIVDSVFSACRPYLAQTIQEVQPERIIALGAVAMKALLGRSAAPLSVRKGYGWIEEGTIPIFTLMSHNLAMGNRFLTEWFEEDLAWAVSSDVSDLYAGSARDGVACVVTSVKESEDAVAALSEAEWITYDTETVAPLFSKDFEIVSMAITGKGSEDAFVWDRVAVNDKDMMDPVLALLADPRKKVVAQNAKYDANAVYSHFGIFVRGLHFDTMLAKKILEPESGAGLDLIQEGVGMGGGKEIAVRELARIGRAIKKANSDTALSEIGNVSWARKIKVDKSLHKTYAYGLMDADTCDRYCARDTVSTDKAASMLEARLSEVPPVQMVWEKILRPAAEAIEHVERWGIKVDMGRVAKFDESLQKELGLILSRIYAKKEFRLGSLVELREFLYKRHKLPVVKKTPKGLPSTDAETLNSLLDRSLKPAQRVVVEDLLAYRKLEKLHSTYAAKMGAFMRGDGRVHPSFNLVGARSGRMSCSKPSLQQIPRAATEIAAMARGCFVAPPGRVFVQLDYSQLELRVVAMLSGDENMIEVFKSGVDYHLRTAQLVSKRAWGIAPEDVTKEHRTMAKGISFGLLYGMGLGTLAKNMGATQDEAEKIQKAIFGNFPKMKKWCDDHLKLARAKGYTVTYWDGKPARIRPLFGIASSDDKARSTAENGSFNTPVQGTASDMCVVALTRCVNWLLDTGFPAKLVLTVHDSLMFEVDEDRALELVSVVRGLMTDFPSNGVPIVVDAEIGPDWGQLEPLKEGDLA